MLDGTLPMMNKKSVHFCGTMLILGASMIGLNGCSLGLVGLGAVSSGKVFSGEDARLLERNQAAADYIAQQAQGAVTKNTPIKIGLLSDARDTAMTSAFGRFVPEQIGARLFQLGYNVHLDEVSPYIKSQSVNLATKSRVELTGTYLPGDADVQVNLRVVDHTRGRMIAFFDYTIPLNSQIDEMLEPQPAVFRMAQ